MPLLCGLGVLCGEMFGILRGGVIPNAHALTSGRRDLARIIMAAESGNMCSMLAELRRRSG